MERPLYDATRDSTLDAGSFRVAMRAVKELGLLRTLESALSYARARYLSDWNVLEFGGERFTLVPYLYNQAWRNNRSVEIALANAVLSLTPRTFRILEVGNVLRHYLELSTFQHYTVVDKYEKGRGVINEDILTHSPPEPYDLVISVSTLEHVGFDEPSHDPAKLTSALNHLQSILRPTTGMTFVTMPYGYNPEVDRIADDGCYFAGFYFLRRVSTDNRWEAVAPEIARLNRSRQPYRGDNIIVVASTPTWDKFRHSAVG